MSQSAATAAANVHRATIYNGVASGAIPHVRVGHAPHPGSPNLSEPGSGKIAASRQRALQREGGLCCVIAPSGGPEHRYPVDCWRYYTDGFRALARWARLDIVDVSTEWTSSGYGDGSEEWKDTFMVCSKPRLPFAASLRRRATDTLLLTVLRDALKRHR